jgi:hypothetical protein
MVGPDRMLFTHMSESARVASWLLRLRLRFLWLLLALSPAASQRRL